MEKKGNISTSWSVPPSNFRVTLTSIFHTNYYSEEAYLLSFPPDLLGLEDQLQMGKR